MGTYIKSSTGLVSLDQPITSETIKQALGYLPVNFSGNYEDLTNKPELFSGNYDDLINKPIDSGVWIHDSNNLYIVDENENVIALIDEKGIHSIDFDINGKSVKDHIEDKDIHISAAEREKWNDPLSSTDSELYIADDSGNILALFDVNGLTVTAVKTNTINGVDANDLATKTYIKGQIDAINETLNNIDSILEPVEAEIDTLQQTVAEIKTKTDNLEATENDVSLVITDKDNNAVAQFDENGLTVIAVKTNSINGTAVNEFSTKADLATKAQELQSAITSGDNAVNTQLNTHITNKSNPHGVTAAQVGVYTTTEANNTFAPKVHNHDDVYSKLGHTHDLPTVSEGANIDITKTDLDYKVALASEIELTKVKATTVSADILETPTLLQEGDNLSVSDINGNIVAQIDSSGLVVTEVKATKATVYDESSGQYEVVMTPTAVDNRINSVIKADLNKSKSNSAGKTIASLTQTNGVIDATFQDISITESQVSDLKHSTVSNGNNITVAESNRNYTVALNDEITLTKVNADTVTVNGKDVALREDINELNGEALKIDSAPDAKSIKQAIADVNTSLGELELTDDKVKLSTELKTYYNVGKVTTASGTNPITIGNAGDSLRTVFNNLFNMDETQPSITANPSITLTLSSTASDEYGTKIKSLSYSISTEDGAYTNDSTTGVTWSSYKFTGSGFSEPSTTFTSKTGTVTLSSDYEVGVSSAISLTVEGTHTAGNVAKTNLGNNSDPEIKIAAGTKTDVCTFSKSSKYYDYSVLTTSETAPTTGLTRQTSSGANATYSYAKDQYLYLYSHSSGKKIQTNVLGQWADVNTTQIGEVKITLSSGATNITYYAYRTDKFADAGSAQYKLV